MRDDFTVSLVASPAILDGKGFQLGEDILQPIDVWGGVDERQTDARSYKTEILAQVVELSSPTLCERLGKNPKIEHFAIEVDDVDGMITKIFQDLVSADSVQNDYFGTRRETETKPSLCKSIE